MTTPAPAPGGPLDQRELRTLAVLLARYVVHDLDQWETWRFDLPEGPIYVTIANRLPDGVPEETFHTVWPLPPHLTEAEPGSGGAGSACNDITGA